MGAMFSVTYEILTPESAESGEVEETGFILENATLREAAAEVFGTRTSRCGGVECVEPNDSRIGEARWITVYHGMEYETGAHENRALHIPDHVTAASRRRIARLCGIEVRED